MKKFLKIFAVVLLLFIAFLIAIPFLFKGKIIEAIKQEANKSLDAKLNFGDVDLTLISSFPNLKLSLQDLSIIGNAPFDGDTLIYTKNISIKVGLYDVVSGGQTNIKSIVLDNPFINILILKDGKANYNITKESKDASTSSAEPTAFKLALNSYEINNGKINYDDRSLTFRMLLNDVNHKGSGDFTQDLFLLKTQTEVKSTDVWYGGVKYLNQVQSKLLADLDIDMKNFKFTFKENELALNDLSTAFDGWLAMPKDDIDMDLKWKVNRNDFKSFMSLIPGVYSSSFKDVKCTGNLAMNGFVKGTMTDTRMPGYGLNVKIDNGNFQYPSLPSAIKNTIVDLKINNPDGVTDHTIIDLKKMHVEIGGDPFDAKLFVTTPVSDANIDAMLKGKINLGNLKNTVPLPQGMILTGILNADMLAKGRYSAIEQKRYEDFNASGTMSVAEMNYNDTKSGDKYFIKQFMLTFNPKNVTLNNLEATVKNTDFKATGTIDNLIGYYVKDDLLKGAFTLVANKINVNDWMVSGATSEGQAVDTSKMSVVQIPANIDFDITTAIGKLIYDDIIMTNVKGNIVARDEKLSMNNLFMNLMGGAMVMNGTYSAKILRNPITHLT
ncbi:MAG: AsmA family protein [Bacteroidetes bacterium]|nr:AsmA family protein [Bacteroidota bacterium]